MSTMSERPAKIPPRPQARVRKKYGTDTAGGCWTEMTASVENVVNPPRNPTPASMRACRLNRPM